MTQGSILRTLAATLVCIGATSLVAIEPAAADEPCIRRLSFSVHSGYDGLRRRSRIQPFVMALDRLSGAVRRHAVVFPDGRTDFAPPSDDEPQRWFYADGQVAGGVCLDNANVGAIGFRVLLDPGDGWLSGRDEWDLLDLMVTDRDSGRYYIQRWGGRLVHHFTHASPEYAIIPAFAGFKPELDLGYRWSCFPSIGLRFAPPPGTRIEVIAWSFSPTASSSMRATILPYDSVFDDFFLGSVPSLGISSSATPLFVSGHWIDDNRRNVGWGRVESCRLSRVN